MSGTGSDKTDTTSHNARNATWWLWRQDAGHSKQRLSPILLRIMAVNVMALAILVGSLLYLGRYQDRIIATELEAMTLQARIIASAVAEDAVVIDENDNSILSPLLARMMVRRLAETTETRTRLFNLDDALLADSQSMLGTKGKIEVKDINPPEKSWERLIGKLFDVIDFIHQHREYPLYAENELQRGSDYAIVSQALQGTNGTQVWRRPHDGLILAAAVPVQHYNSQLGAVILTHSDAAIDKALTTVRIDILEIFLITLFITLLLSVYLARAIARPIRLLALAAERLRYGQTQIVGLAGTADLLKPDAIPDMTNRHDEIGDLSGALRELTSALAKRIGEIENFAADVAHEIKNPLTSLRSAVETAERIEDPVAKGKLMRVIRDDVDRMNRLITDISSASRLDAELSRAHAVVIDVRKMMDVLVDYYSQPAHENSNHIGVTFTADGDNLMILGVEVRLVQVVQNLIENAISFSPEGATVDLKACIDGQAVLITVSDKGPGIPENKLDAIFDRFYSERPKSEKFGTHSGLGLSIARQIVGAHRGTISADNIKDETGKIIGAQFAVWLPRADDGLVN